VLYVVTLTRAHRLPSDIPSDTTVHFLRDTTGRVMLSTAVGIQGRIWPTLAKKISQCALLAKIPIAKQTKGKLASIDCKNKSA